MSIARAAGKLSIITKKKHLLLLFSNPSPLSPPQSHLRSPNFNFNFNYYYTTIRNNNNEYDDDDDDNETTRTRDHHPKHQSDPPHPIPNRPLRAPRGPDRDRDRDRFRDMPPTSSRGPAQVPPLRNEVSGRPNNHPNNFTTKHKDLGLGGIHHKPPATATATATATRDGESTAKAADSFLQKFKLGFDAKETTPPQSTPTTQQIQDPSPPPPQDADDIFKKMKENGLIPNAVAMLDGLCKDGLVQEAMKLFGLMREKGTIPEVVIYTAVVQGFCTAHKFDDAKRIFRKMQNNGVSPNAFTYTVLIQGLCKGGTLQDALDFSIEMLESGHSPNVATFTALIDGFCKEKGVEEAQGIIRNLREKSFFVNEKAVREHLDKKGPFSPLVWEAVFGKRSSQTLF